MSLSIKAGATLQLILQINNDDGSAFPLTNVTPSSQVRDGAGRLIGTITFTTTATVGQLLVAQATDGWPPGLLWWDIKLTQGNIVLKSDTIAITVVPAITK